VTREKGKLLSNIHEKAALERKQKSPGRGGGKTKDFQTKKKKGLKAIEGKVRRGAIGGEKKRFESPIAKKGGEKQKQSLQCEGGEKSANEGEEEQT